MDEKYMSSVFKEWIKNHETKDYQIIENNQDCIELNTDYGKAEIHFTDVTEGTIVEFNIVSYKDQEVHDTESHPLPYRKGQRMEQLVLDYKYMVLLQLQTDH